MKTWSSVSGVGCPTASSPHDGVKGAVFPEFGARHPCGWKKIDDTTPHGGCMACLVEAKASSVDLLKATRGARTKLGENSPFFSVVS